jgi:hypothetical protein
MTTSIYNPCLLITAVKEKFAIVEMQTDDILELLNNQFTALE